MGRGPEERSIMARSLILALLLSAARSGWSQEVTGAIEGRLLGSDSAPLGSAEVVMSGPSLQGERTVASDERGYFRLVGLPVGPYTVRVRYIGFRPVRYENVAIRLGRTTMLGEIRLEPQA